MGVVPGHARRVRAWPSARRQGEGVEPGAGSKRLRHALLSVPRTHPARGAAGPLHVLSPRPRAVLSGLSLPSALTLRSGLLCQPPQSPSLPSSPKRPSAPQPVAHLALSRPCQHLSLEGFMWCFPAASPRAAALSASVPVSHSPCRGPGGLWVPRPGPPTLATLGRRVPWERGFCAASEGQGLGPPGFSPSGRGPACLGPSPGCIEDTWRNKAPGKNSHWHVWSLSGRWGEVAPGHVALLLSLAAVARSQAWGVPGQTALAAALTPALRFPRRRREMPGGRRRKPRLRPAKRRPSRPWWRTRRWRPRAPAGTRRRWRRTLKVRPPQEPAGRAILSRSLACGWQCGGGDTSASMARTPGQESVTGLLRAAVPPPVRCHLESECAF